MAFLAASGLVVDRLAGMDLDGSTEIWNNAAPTPTRTHIFDYCLAIDSDDADGLYLTCTGMLSVEILDDFERRTGSSAISSVQAGYWASLRRLGIDPRRPRCGRLLA